MKYLIVVLLLLVAACSDRIYPTETETKCEMTDGVCSTKFNYMKGGMSALIINKDRFVY